VVGHERRRYVCALTGSVMACAAGVAGAAVVCVSLVLRRCGRCGLQLELGEVSRGAAVDGHEAVMQAATAAAAATAACGSVPNQRRGWRMWCPGQREDRGEVAGIRTGILAALLTWLDWWAVVAMVVVEARRAPDVVLQIASSALPLASLEGEDAERGQR